MQPPTEPTGTKPTSHQALHGDEDELFRRHHRELVRAVASVVRAPHALIEDACQTAWTLLLLNQPERRTVFGWLRTVAIHEAYRLSKLSRRDDRLELVDSGPFDWADTIPDSRTLDDAVEALEALRVLASLPDRQRQDLALKIAGYSYHEIRRRVPGRTWTNVNKSLAKARRRIRQARARSAISD
jgi:DNA-directed RNA polymerase specialized sigma24 family protein